jgi:hypothetical protein
MSVNEDQSFQVKPTKILMYVIIHLITILIIVCGIYMITFWPIFASCIVGFHSIFLTLEVYFFCIVRQNNCESGPGPGLRPGGPISFIITMSIMGSCFQNIMMVGEYQTINDLYAFDVVNDPMALYILSIYLIYSWLVVGLCCLLVLSCLCYEIYRLCSNCYGYCYKSNPELSTLLPNSVALIDKTEITPV